MQVGRQALLSGRNAWLLLLPLTALASWCMQEMPVAVGVSGYANSVVWTSNGNHFYQQELPLSQLYSAATDKIIINAQTEKYLSQAVDRRGVEFDQVLFEKTFPAAQGQQLGRLLRCYQAYKRAEVLVGLSYLPVLTNTQLLDYRALQKVFFGRIAQNLFADHHQFYHSVEAAGVQLIAPILAGIAAAPVCGEISEAANE